MLYKCIMPNTSAKWQQTAHTLYYPSCSTNNINLSTKAKGTLIFELQKSLSEVSLFFSKFNDFCKLKEKKHIYQQANKNSHCRDSLQRQHYDSLMNPSNAARPGSKLKKPTGSGHLNSSCRQKMETLLPSSSPAKVKAII